MIRRLLLIKESGVELMLKFKLNYTVDENLMDSIKKIFNAVDSIIKTHPDMEIEIEVYFEDKEYGYYY